MGVSKQYCIGGSKCIQYEAGRYQLLENRHHLANGSVKVAVHCKRLIV